MTDATTRCSCSNNRLELCRIPVLFCCFFFFLLLPFQLKFRFCLGLDSEGMTLLRFRERVAEDPSNALSSWNGDVYDADPCSWLGVECFHGKVVALNLKDLCLRVTLPPELGNLSHIRSILLDNKLLLSKNPGDENPLTASCHDNTYPLDIAQSVGFVPKSRKLLQAPISSKINVKKDNKKTLLPSPVPSSAPSLSHPAHNSPQESQQRSRNKPTNQDSAPSPSPSHKVYSLAHAPTAKTPISSPSPSLSPSPKVHSPAHAPTLKNTSDSSSKVGAPPPVSSYSSPAPSAAVTSNGKSTTKERGVVIGLSVAGGTLAVILSVVAIVICRSSKVVTVKPWATGLSGQLQRAFVTGVPKLKRVELETACEDFSNIIGTLSDSTVYKGTLSSGVEIAVISSSVKSRQQWSKKLQAQFRKKVETLSKVNHKNFVNLIGYCEEEKPFTRMMVFEYAPNGTLFEHLHIKEAERLDWRMRLRIVMGLAYCIEHMHQLDPPIPHRDLQSSSVYLSQDYAAKVSDFSFWTEISSEKMRSPSMQLLEASMADKESNVHSLGVVLLEIMTGRIPYSHNGSVEDWVWECVRCDYLPRETLDPTLTRFEENEMLKLFEVIKDCMHPDPKERPKMREVAIKLMEITGIEPDGATPRISPLWWAELEVMATEAS